GTQILSGTPTQTGSFPITITATDSNGCTGSSNVTIVINCQTITVGPSTIPAGTVGAVYTSTAFSKAGAIGTTTFAETGTLPVGMTLSSGGVLSGTPSQSGSFPITVTATDSNGCTGSKAYTLVINCPTITVGPSTIPSGTAGTAYTTTAFTQTGGVGSVTFTETGALPAGLTLSSAGVLSGTPTQTGSFPITVTVTDSAGCTGGKSYTLVISCGTITVNPASVSAGTAGVAYSTTTFTQTGGIGTITFSETGSLPAGLTLSSTGVLSGTPTQTGTFPITVTATDSNGCTGSRPYTVVINCPTITVNPPAIPSGIAGVAYFPRTFSQTGGVGAVVFSESGTLPAGMTFSGGVLSGTPLQTGSFPFTITATDSNGCTGSSSYMLGVGCPAINVSPGTLPSGTAGAPYPATTFSQTGGPGTTTFTQSGTLPTGMTFSSGVLSGTPAQTGTFPITVTATDQNGCIGSQGLTLTIGCQVITVEPESIPSGTSGSVYQSTNFTQSGGIGTVTFSVLGTLPSGLAFSGGVLSGTPTQTGVFPITVTATDGNGCTGSRDYIVTIACPSVDIAVNPGTLSSGTKDALYPPVTFTATGGTGPDSFTEVGILPNGMTFASGVLSGTPTQAGSFPISVAATDASGCAGINNYLLVITCPDTAITVGPGTLAAASAGTAYSPVTFSGTGSSGPFVLDFAGALPAGMTYAAGVLSGTPTQTGSFQFTVSATDASGCSGATNYTLTIGCPTITVSPPSLLSGTAGTAYASVTFTQSGGAGTVTFTDSGTLPAGMTFAAGVLSGTPTQTGSFPLTVTATDQDGCTGSQTYTLTIGCSGITVSPGTVPTGTAGVAYSPVTFTQTSGIGTVSFSETGPLPVGMNFSDGILSGTPTQTGSFPIRVTATDANGCQGSQNVTLTVNCPVINVGPGTIPQGTAGVAYVSTTFTQTGGVGAVTFAESGTLPTGMAFSAGVLSGTPTVTGSFPIVITATDHNGCIGSRKYTVAVNCPAIAVGPGTIAQGTAGVAYTSTAFSQTGGVGATRFSKTGAVPNGMSFTSAGILSGTPLETGSFVIAVTATDKNGCTGSKNYTLTINCPVITVTPTMVPLVIQYEPSQPTQFAQTGGVGLVSYSTTGTLPAGITLSPTGLLSGTPTQAGVFPITVVATDANGCTGRTTVNMEVTILDKCLKDDLTSSYVQFNSQTGDYLFTFCGPNGWTLSGKGTVRFVNSVINVTDTRTDRRVTIMYSLGQLTGRATLVRIPAPSGNPQYLITDTNPHAVCLCGG
ncbi:MAG TPA: putative Ig domain-containing protein, partial [Blastocatellia bacterium]|nr:putative Ig domain-containing protein [Blastocatellia bacterium]